MESSDHIIDIGPEGMNGGQIVAEGEVKEIVKNENSITGDYQVKSLFHLKKEDLPKMEDL